ADMAAENMVARLKATPLLPSRRDGARAADGAAAADMEFADAGVMEPPTVPGPCELHGPGISNGAIAPRHEATRISYPRWRAGRRSANPPPPSHPRWPQ